MIEQGKFGSPAGRLCRGDAIDTSAAAADAFAASSGAVERRVLLVISHHEQGCTQQQVLDALPSVPYPTVTARFSALLERKYIVDTEERRTGRSGRPQRVVKITGAGLAALSGE